MAYIYDFLKDVKNALGITGTYQDNTLNIYINEVKDYLRRAGVDENLINSQVCAGVIARGVIDLWNYGSGDGKLSNYFYDRVSQLALTTLSDPIPDMNYYCDVPAKDDLAMYGWIELVYGAAAKNLTPQELNVDDEQDIRVTITHADGSKEIGVDCSTGNRRRIVIDRTKAITVMPNTIYDTEQSKYINHDGSTALDVTDDFYDCELLFEVFGKGVLNNG